MAALLAYLHFRSISFHFDSQEDEPRSTGAFLPVALPPSSLSSRNILSRPGRCLLSHRWTIVASSCDSLIILIRDLNRKRRSAPSAPSEMIFFYLASSEQNQLSIRDYHSPLICTGFFPGRFIRQGAKFLSRTVSPVKIIEKRARNCFSVTSSSGWLWITKRTALPSRLCVLMRLSSREWISIFYVVARVSRCNKKPAWRTEKREQIPDHVDRRFPARLLSSARQIDVAIL